MNTIEKQVRAASQAWIDAFNLGKVDLMADGYTQNALMEVRLFDAKPTTFEGRDSIHQFWTDFMQKSPNNLVYTAVNIRVIDSHHAVLSADWSMNIVSGFITEELWVKNAQGQWQLERDNFSVISQHAKSNRPALVLVDFQADYFAAGNMPLVGMEQAATNAASLLHHWREHDLPIIHIQHIFPDNNADFFASGSSGCDIHPALTPKGNETQLIKSDINAFNNAGLGQVLAEQGITSLVITGAMAHLCVAAIARQASDQGYPCQVVNDAWAAPEQSLIDTTAATLSFGYAQMVTSNDVLS